MIACAVRARSSESLRRQQGRHLAAPTSGRKWETTPAAPTRTAMVRSPSMNLSSGFPPGVYQVTHRAAGRTERWRIKRQRTAKHRGINERRNILRKRGNPRAASQVWRRPIGRIRRTARRRVWSRRWRCCTLRAAVNSSGKAYRFLTPSERLPEGLPVSFTSKDRDGDGQLSMAEFASTWTNGTVSEFSRWDVNGDGFATAAECLAAEKSGGGR